jgi:hypothetical protein
MPYARISILVALLSIPASAGHSTDYSLEPAVLDGGGAGGASADYTINPSMGAGITCASANYGLRGGYAGQLMDLTELVIDEPSALTINEGGTLQLVVVATYDDASKAVLSAGDPEWSIESGPITGIDSNGIVTAGLVYQNAAAIVRAALGGVSDTVGITVVNTGLDNFGPYAADGLPDAWQVQSFGLGGTRGGPGADYDYDGLTNLQEFAFGTDPSSNGGSVSWSESVLLAPGVPVAYVSQGGIGAFSYRAVFSRPKDYLAWGLSYKVEFSADLNTWKASSSTPIRLADDGQSEAVYVPYLISVNGRKATFFRVGVSLQ